VELEIDRFITEAELNGLLGATLSHHLSTCRMQKTFYAHFVNTDILD
jgi:hypothetical protein